MLRGLTRSIKMSGRRRVPAITRWRPHAEKLRWNLSGTISYNIKSRKVKRYQRKLLEIPNFSEISNLEISMIYLQRFHQQPGSQLVRDQLSGNLPTEIAETERRIICLIW